MGLNTLDAIKSILTTITGWGTAVLAGATETTLQAIQTLLGSPAQAGEAASAAAPLATEATVQTLALDATLTDGSQLSRSMGMDGATQRQIEVDHEGRAVGIDVVHNKVHTGDLFYVNDERSVAAGATFRWVFTCGAVPAHVELRLRSDLAGVFRLYAGSTHATPGTAIPSRNRNGSSAKVPLSAVTHTPGTPADGTRIATWPIGGSGGGARTAGEGGSRLEYVAVPGGVYTITFTCTAASGTAIVATEADWYEEVM